VAVFFRCVGLDYAHFGWVAYFGCADRGVDFGCALFGVVRSSVMLSDYVLVCL